MGALDRQWQRIGEPGTWWVGRERVAFAREVRAARNCPLCIELKAVVTPYAVGGDHRSSTSLPAQAVDAVHRITTDPGRLTHRWFCGLIGHALTEEQYVELVGIVAHQTILDSFAFAVGAAEVPLPEPGEGEPSRERPHGARVHSAWVATVDPDAAEGAIAEHYRVGGTQNVVRALTLVPEEQLGYASLVEPLYVPLDHFADWAWQRTLTRSQLEVAARNVSSS